MQAKIQLSKDRLVIRREKNVKLMCWSYIILFLTFWISYLVIYPIILQIWPVLQNDYEKYFETYVLSLTYFTKQTNILGFILVICLLKKKKIIEWMMACASAFIVVNIIAFVGINSYLEWDKGFLLICEFLVHLLMPISFVTLFLYVLFFFNKDKIKLKKVMLISITTFTFFSIIAVIVNFIYFGNLIEDISGVPPGWFSVYGFLTNFNPEIGGSWTRILIVYPLFLGFILGLDFFLETLTPYNNKVFRSSNEKNKIFYLSLAILNFLVMVLNLVVLFTPASELIFSIAFFSAAFFELVALSIYVYVIYIYKQKTYVENSILKFSFFIFCLTLVTNLLCALKYFFFPTVAEIFNAVMCIEILTFYIIGVIVANMILFFNKELKV